ncbi:MAG: hypothetical protein WBG48_18210 [Pricia sp.]
MEQTEFLDKNVFTDLKKVNIGPDQEEIHHFSETDFEIVLQRAEHFGIGIYTVETWRDGEFLAIAKHEDFKKKATDPRWYKKAFLTFKTRQPGLSYSGTYKVSNKLLTRE